MLRIILFLVIKQYLFFREKFFSKVKFSCRGSKKTFISKANFLFFREKNSSIFLINPIFRGRGRGGGGGFLPRLRFFICCSYSNQQGLLELGDFQSNYMRHLLMKKWFSRQPFFHEYTLNMKSHYVT